MTTRKQLLIVDLGSQTTGLLAKAFALQAVESTIVRGDGDVEAGDAQATALIAAVDAAILASGAASLAGVVLSGSPASVSSVEGQGYLQVVRHVLRLRAGSPGGDDAASSMPQWPVLGVCFGFQALSVLHGGSVVKGPGEYGPALVKPVTAVEGDAQDDAFVVALHSALRGVTCSRGSDVLQELGEGVTRTPALVSKLRAASPAPPSHSSSPRRQTELHVWSSHGDDVAATGVLHPVARGRGTAFAAAANARLRLMAVQWHPEHSQTCDAAGVEVLYTFATACGLRPRHVTHEERSRLLLARVVSTLRGDIQALDSAAQAAGKPPPAFMVALSGGVDSAVAAGLLAKALREEKASGDDGDGSTHAGASGSPGAGAGAGAGTRAGASAGTGAGANDGSSDAPSSAARGVARLHLCYVDTGLMRDEDSAHVAKLATALGLSVATIDAKDLFFAALRGVMDDNEVRMAVGGSFAKVLAAERERHGADTKMVQGTLASDVVESTRIKAHHNVGGLPKAMAVHVFEPLRSLFKSDVRRLAAALGLGSEFVTRRPFPGPGLALRVVGAEVNPANVAMARAANAIWRDVLQRHGVPHAQSLAAVCPTITFVGVRGDERTCGCLCLLRAVLTRDFMTAWPADIPQDVLLEAQAEIVQRVPSIGRVCYDVTSKPPACVEFR